MLRHITFTVFITTSMNTLATGMVPETSVLLVDEKRGEASINIKNNTYIYQRLDIIPCDIVVPISSFKKLFSNLTGVLFIASKKANNSGI